MHACDVTTIALDRSRHKYKNMKERKKERESAHARARKNDHWFQNDANRLGFERSLAALPKCWQTRGTNHVPEELHPHSATMDPLGSEHRAFRIRSGCAT